MVHLVSDCTHLTWCPKLLVRITFPPNRFGAFDMLGNVGEWVDQCLPQRVKGSQECAVYLFVGGGWFLPGQDLVPNSYWSRHIDIREPYVGFRLVEDI
ncbi:SUMF1/EgtB/PvdO family nonheme iron enzyme [Vibrio campbellii]|uniref:SUMF1/EgtB/PvdO family nonheme iron enzyme n=1 Tax=Vibrio campbellii TaxID=680 RepID=UPI003F735DC3